MFEVFRKHGFYGWIESIEDHRRQVLHLDDIIFQPLHIRKFVAHGAAESFGLSDACIDHEAMHIIRDAQLPGFHWMPACIGSLMIHRPIAPLARVWKTAVLSGVLFTGIAWQGHWILLQVFAIGTTLHLIFWDGQHGGIPEFCASLATQWVQDLGLKSWHASADIKFPQQLDYSCGTILLTHLGWCLGQWTFAEAPSEFRWHAELLATQSPGIYYAEGKASGKGGSTSEELDVVWQLRDILAKHGVEQENTEDRAHQALRKIGLQPLQAALSAKNVWSSLKALGSQPKHNFMWIRPAELEQQIKRRAESKFKVSTSKRKTKPQPVSVDIDIDPEHLELLPHTFITEQGHTVKQLSMEQVVAHSTGIAFARLAQILPFLREGKSLSLEALAVLTTKQVPVESQGMLPVTDIRFPALYRPTGEPLLLQGSLVQLGDQTIVREQEHDLVDAQPVATTTVKVCVFRDEWPGPWDVFQQSPVREILRAFPHFVLCKGLKCGSECLRFHAPVDLELDTVIQDLWNRTWQNAKGQKTSVADSEQFHVMLRLPHLLLKQILPLSGKAGLDVEPRTQDGRSPSTETVVLWIPGGSLEDALHKSRTLDKAICVARHCQRFGIRVPEQEAQAIHSQIAPEAPYMNFQILQIYEMRPLPHGTQRHGVLALIKGIQWQARPLQPCRSDFMGMGWTVGAAAPPPRAIIQTKSGDVTITLQKAVSTSKHEPTVLTSRRTQKHIRSEAASSSSTSHPTTREEDPWMHFDPWSKHRPLPPTWSQEDTDEKMAPVSTKLAEVQSQLRDDLLQELQRTSDSRIAKLEVGLEELREQNDKFEGWFQDAADANSKIQSQMQVLHEEVSVQKQDTASLAQEIRGGFSSMQLMLQSLTGNRMDETDPAKRARAD